jgi:ubiquinone biosynthesis protein
MAAMLSSALQLFRENEVLLPADLVLLFGVLVRLQGVGQRVGTEVRLTDLLQPYVEQMIAERFDPRRVAMQLGRFVRSWDRFAVDLPDTLRAVLDQARARKLGIDIQLHDADRAADQLVDGMVAAAALLSSAQLISRRARPVLGSLSVPGLVAAGLGVITWQRLAARRHPRRSWVGRARGLAAVARH